jgi:hypothetical protein
LQQAVTIQEVIIQLQLIVEECTLRNEREGYFAALYLKVTKAVKTKLEENYFDDNARMEQLDVVFANRFLVAYHQYKTNQPCTESWKVAFTTCKQWKPLVLQHLLLGMNAHIGLDLGIAAATVCPGPSIHNLQSDFNKINEILGDLVDTVQEELTQIWPILKPIDWLAGKMDEEIAMFSMGIARDASWQTAIAYAQLNTQSEKENFIAQRDAKVAVFGRKVANPGWLLQLLIAVLRIFESGTVTKKIETLTLPPNGIVQTNKWTVPITN